MTFFDTLDGVVDGWRDFSAMVRLRRRPETFVLKSCHGDELDFWDGLSPWWVEDNVYKPLRDLRDSVEELFGDSSVISSTSQNIESGSIKIQNSNFYWYNPPENLTGVTDTITGVGISNHSPEYVRINTSKPKGEWVWNKIHVESDEIPNIFRRAIVELILGAKWKTHDHYLKKRQRKSKQYLILIPIYKSPIPSI